MRLFSFDFILLIALSFYVNFSTAQQSDYWQQRAEYEMVIDMDVEKHQYNGKQKLVYYNNSNDELNRVFYHLYFNAFQPGSMMDVRSTTIIDPDRRVGDRISKLKEDEIGFQKISSLTQDGKPVKFEHVGTILEVELAQPIAPGSKSVFEMEWLAQVPKQIRRSGRNSTEGIDYSMSQWYPKMCEYDFMGWHANPYVGREFHGIWGDFDVTINIDKKYILGGTGILQNPQEIGYGYETEGQAVKRPEGDKLSWNFKAKNVHDFVWAADPDYTHVKAKTEGGATLHFLYQKNENTEEAWAQLPDYTVKAFKFIEKTYGKYPYQQYSVIQGGDGGMEYPMATLITGHRPLSSLVGVTIHEVMHTWYQMLMGTNEALYAWMDEGFTSYASNIVKAHLFPSSNDPHSNTYMRYYYFARAGEEEALCTHADHFETNSAYGTGAYAKGAIYMHQLGYVVGQEALDRGILRYYDEWHFKHPTPNDFLRVIEKESGMELDWYNEYFVHSVRTIDYSVQSVKAKDKKTTEITLERLGSMIMPIDVEVEYSNGTKEMFNIPLQIMRGAKPQENKNQDYTVLEDWAWVNSSYSFTIPKKVKQISAVRIDPSKRLADMKAENNTFPPEE